MADPWLFSYGTLSDSQYIQLLLRRLPDYVEAELHDYGLFVHPKNGYLFIQPNEGEQVFGKLFRVTWKELELIDCWEDVPLYEREIRQFKTEKGEWVEAFVYTQQATKGLPLSEAKPKSRQQILEEIEDFLEQMRRGGFMK